MLLMYVFVIPFGFGQTQYDLLLQGGHVIDPYEQLPKMFKDVSDQDFERLSEDD